jgi:hypothetical protein
VPSDFNRVIETKTTKAGVLNPSLQIKWWLNGLELATLQTGEMYNVNWLISWVGHTTLPLGDHSPGAFVFQVQIKIIKLVCRGDTVGLYGKSHRSPLRTTNGVGLKYVHIRPLTGSQQKLLDVVVLLAN